MHHCVGLAVCCRYHPDGSRSDNAKVDAVHAAVQAVRRKNPRFTLPLALPYPQGLSMSVAWDLWNNSVDAHSSLRAVHQVVSAQGAPKILQGWHATRSKQHTGTATKAVKPGDWKLDTVLRDRYYKVRKLGKYVDARHAHAGTSCEIIVANLEKERKSRNRSYAAFVDDIGKWDPKRDDSEAY